MCLAARKAVRATVTENESPSDESDSGIQRCSGINSSTGTGFFSVGHGCLSLTSTDLKQMKFCLMIMFSQQTDRFPTLRKPQMYKSFTIAGLEREVNTGGAQKPSKVMTFSDGLD